MISYSTQFPVTTNYTKNLFIDMVIRWNQGSKFDKFNLQEWDKQNYKLSWQEDKKHLDINDYPEMGIVASRLEKEDTYGLWRTDFILNYAKNYLTIKVTMETTQFTTDFSPTYYPPYFVKMVINEGFAGMDGILPVTKSVFIVSNKQKSYIEDIFKHENELFLPVVVVTQTSDGIMPIELNNLAFQLQGVAHVLAEGERGLFSNIKIYDEDDKKPGKIYLVFPNKNMRVKVMNLNGEKAENPDLIISRIINVIYEYTNQVLRRDCDTWEGIQNENLHRQNKVLLNSKKKIEDELFEAFGDQLEKTEKRNEELNSQNQKLMAENQALRIKLASKDKTPALYLGEERDFYIGEIREIILEILSCYQRKKNTRRDHIIKDLIENNEYEKLPEKRREYIKNILNGYESLTGSLKNKLEAMGFEISDDGKHYKWTYSGDHRYVVTAAKTSSDCRAGKNLASEINNLML